MGMYISIDLNRVMNEGVNSVIDDVKYQIEDKIHYLQRQKHRAEEKKKKLKDKLLAFEERVKENKDYFLTLLTKVCVLNLVDFRESQQIQNITEDVSIYLSSILPSHKPGFDYKFNVSIKLNKANLSGIFTFKIDTKKLNSLFEFNEGDKLFIDYDEVTNCYLFMLRFLKVMRQGLRKIPVTIVKSLEQKKQIFRNVYHVEPSASSIKNLN